MSRTLWDVIVGLVGFVGGCAVYGVIGGTVKEHVTAEINKLRADVQGWLSGIAKKV